jgi:hypothetical protein
VVRTGCRGQGGDLSCERQVLGDGEVVVRTAKYSELGLSCCAGRQVLGSLVIRHLLDVRHFVGPSPGPRHESS